MKPDHLGRTEIIIPLAKIKAVWFDQNLTQTKAAAKLGIHTKTLRSRAAAFGLPERHKLPCGRSKAQVSDPVLFADLWNRGVPTDKLAHRFKITSVTLRKVAVRMGLEARKPGYRGDPMAAGE